MNILNVYMFHPRRYSGWVISNYEDGTLTVDFHAVTPVLCSAGSCCSLSSILMYMLLFSLALLLLCSLWLHHLRVMGQCCRSLFLDLKKQKKNKKLYTLKDFKRNIFKDVEVPVASCH